MKQRIHAIAGVLAMILISLFMIATLYSELMGNQELIARVKSLIVLPGLILLIPCLMIVGGSGFNLAKGRSGRLVDTKKRRMPFIALNGSLILVPSAIVLDMWAGQGRFGLAFYSLQTVEVFAGGINLFLMSLNMKDGLKLTGRLRSSPTRPQGVDHSV